MASDLRDILDIEKKENAILPSLTKDPVKPKAKPTFKKPAGMHRELYALLYNDNNDKPPMMPVLPSYQTAKAKLGCKKVRPWKWMPFTNPARSDGAVLHHWRRLEDEGKDYSFAKFNKKINIPMYTDEEYAQLLCEDTDWTKEETDHLFDLAVRFDCRWHVVFDRFDHDSYPQDNKRTVEDLKSRFYMATNLIEKVRLPEGEKFEGFLFDAEHEQKRKKQLMKLFERTKEQVRDESVLVNELKKIEMRKKDRARKSHDFQKLLSFDPSKGERKVERRKRKFPVSGPKGDSAGAETEDRFEHLSIKFLDYKSNGNMLRSVMLKLPSSVSQKRVRIIEQKQEELKVVPNLMPSEKVIQLYDKLRKDIIYLHELKTVESSVDADLQGKKSKYQLSNISGLLAPGKKSNVQPSSSASQPIDNSKTTKTLKD